MHKKIIIPALAFGGILISAAGMMFSSSAQPWRWMLALLLFLIIGTASLAFRALRTRQALTGFIASIAVLLAASVFFIIVIKNL